MYSTIIINTHQDIAIHQCGDNSQPLADHKTDSLRYVRHKRTFSSAIQAQTYILRCKSYIAAISEISFVMHQAIIMGIPWRMYVCVYMYTCMYIMVRFHCMPLNRKNKNAVCKYINIYMHIVQKGEIMEIRQKIVANVNDILESTIMDLEVGKDYKGFDVWIKSRFGVFDVFIITNRQRITDVFCQKIARHFGMRYSVDTIKYNIRKATLQVKILSNGRVYNDISGNHWGGSGKFWDDICGDIILIED